jgi:Rrf2 family protein
MRMSRASAYAIGAVLHLADAPPEVPVPCSRIAKAGEMPERFLLQVLRNLVNHGILRSTRGVEGGYSLLRPISEITLLHIMEATDGPLIPTVPPLDNFSEYSVSRLQGILRDINSEVCKKLANVKLAELIAPETLSGVGAGN